MRILLRSGSLGCQARRAEGRRATWPQFNQVKVKDSFRKFDLFSKAILICIKAQFEISQLWGFFSRKKWPFWSRQPHFLFWNIRKSETLTWTDFKTKHLSARKRNLSPCQLIFLKTIKNLKLCDPMPAYEEKQINCGLNFPLKHLLQLVLAYSFRTKGIKSYLTGFQKLVFIAFCSNPPDFVLKPFYTNKPHRRLQLPPFSVSKLV